MGWQHKARAISTTPSQTISSQEMLVFTLLPKLYCECNCVKNNKLHTLHAQQLMLFIYGVTYEKIKPWTGCYLASLSWTQLSI